MEFSEFDGLFPFKEMRPSQQTALEKFVEVTNKERKYTILELPTGVGKSGIAITLGRWARKQGGAYLLTIQKMLQTQYMGEFAQDLNELKGASNYHCHCYPTTCEQGAKIAKMDGKTCPDCPYRCAKEEFIQGQFGLTNFAYFCSGVANQKGLFGRRKLLLIDEAHNTEQVLINHSTIDITKLRLQELMLTAPTTFGSKDLDRAKIWLKREVQPAINLFKNNLTLQMNEARKQEDHRMLHGLTHQEADIDLFGYKIDMFLKSESTMWFINHADGKIEIKPLTGELFADELLFSMADHVVFLSATILDPRTFIRNIGLTPKQCGYLGVPSEFPKENRRIIFSPAGSMSYKNYDDTLPKLMHKIERILTKHENEKGIIHCQSYRTMNNIVNHFRGTPFFHRLISHDPGNRSKMTALEIHSEREDGTVLLSPSMTEGLDLKDGLSRFQVVCKAPFGNLASPYIKTRLELDPDWYQWMACLALVQATGRSIRSKEDHAVTYFLDKDINRLLSAGIFPDWWLDSIEFK